MDVARTGLLPMDATATRGVDRPPSSDGGFAAAMASETTTDRATVERAEALVGTRIRAPEGGCSCDAFVSAVAPAATTPRVASPARDREIGAARPPGPGTIIALQSASADRRSPSDDLTDHLHLAIVRNASEMIAANETGLIEVLAIPWERVASDRD